MAFVQVTPDKRTEKPTAEKPTANSSQKSIENETMDDRMGGGSCEQGTNEISSDITAAKMGGGPKISDRGVILDLTVEEPGNPDDGIGDKEQGENINIPILQ
jgi:hypothetical protein